MRTKDTPIILDSELIYSGNQAEAIFQIDPIPIKGFRIDTFNMFNTFYSINSTNNTFILEHSAISNAIQPGFDTHSFETLSQNSVGQQFVCDGLQKSNLIVQAQNNITLNTIVIALQESYDQSPSFIKATIYITDINGNVLSTLAQSDFIPIINNVTSPHLYTTDFDPNFIPPPNYISLPLSGNFVIPQNSYYTIALEKQGTPIIDTDGNDFCRLYNNIPPQSFTITVPDGFISTDTLFTHLQTAINTATGENVVVQYDPSTALYTIDGFNVPYTYNASLSTINTSIGFTASQTGTTLISDSIAMLNAVDYFFIVSRSLSQLSKLIVPSKAYNNVIQKISADTQTGDLLEFINYSRSTLRNNSAITISSIDISIVDKYLRKIPQESKWNLTLVLEEVVVAKPINKFYHKRNQAAVDKYRKYRKRQSFFQNLSPNFWRI